MPTKIDAMENAKLNAEVRTKQTTEYSLNMPDPLEQKRLGTLSLAYPSYLLLFLAS